MKRCKNCYYRRELFGFPDFPACHFAIEEGQLRNCEPECCTHFRPKRRRGPKSAAERADQQQKEILKNAGLPAQYQDHLQLVAWNLYQKALSGDMAAIRELRGILEEGGPAEGRGRKQLANPSKTAPVVIIDDVR